jgi:polyhydroxybutyrate depolymerase
MPAGHNGKTPVGAIVFAHGHQGAAKGVMGNQKLRRVATDLGVALITVKSVG